MEMLAVTSELAHPTAAKRADSTSFPAEATRATLDP